MARSLWQACFRTARPLLQCRCCDNGRMSRWVSSISKNDSMIVTFFPCDSSLSHSEDAYLLAPSVALRVDQDLVRERIRLIRRDGRYMVPLLVRSVHDLHCRSMQLLLHLSPIPCSFRFAPRACQRHLDDPVLPDRLLVCFRYEPAFPPLPLQKLHNEYTAPCLGRVLRRGLLRHRVQVPQYGRRTLIYQRFYLRLSHIWQRQVEHIVGGWR